MGIVAGITPGGFADNAVIKRNHVTIDDLKSVGNIGLTYYYTCKHAWIKIY